MFRTLLGVVFVLLCAGAASAQEDRTPDQDRASTAEHIHAQAFILLPPSRALESPKGSIERQIRSMVGHEADFAREPFQRNRAPCDEALRIDRSVILSAAANARVVMINEAHDAPQTRWAIEQWLADLRDAGFSWYAAEAFGNVSGGRPIPRDQLFGFYPLEPMYGRLLDQADTLGFQFVPYEKTLAQHQAAPNSMAAREEAQARNLAEILAGIPPEQRVLVHAGYGHIIERRPDPGSGNLRMMAEAFREETDIDPVTIDQTLCASPDNAVYYGLAARDPEDGKTDFVIGLPLSQVVDGRPDWRRAAGDQPVDTPAACRSDTAKSVVEARRVDQSQQATPVDRLLLFPGEALPLLLPPGQYRIQCRFSTNDGMTPLADAGQVQVQK